MKYEVVSIPEKTVTGLCTRTSNAAADCGEKLGGLWGAYYGGAARQIPGRRGETSYGLYTNYENGCTGEYDVLVGCETDRAAPAGGQFRSVTIPAGAYAKFTIHGDPQRDVGRFWEQIWQEELPRAFTCDFEEYVPGGDMQNMEINIYIALQRFCQSCGMPLAGEETLGTNADGGKNEEYCAWCYQNGAFTTDCTMEEMIETCLQQGGEETSGYFADPEQARKNMLAWFPTLARWRKAE